MSRALAVAMLLLVALAVGARAAAPFEWRDVDDKSLGLWEGGKPVLVYNHGMISRKGVADRYTRACYFHPVYGLDGELLTEDFPLDHRHHRGLFWAWPHIRIEGKEVNSWIPTGIHYKHEAWVRKQVANARAILETRNGWYVGDKKVVDEHMLLTVHPVAQNGRSIDVELIWTATEHPVALQGAGGKSYGGLTLRFNTRPREKNRIPEKDVAITVPDGLTKKDLAIARLPWADFTAPFPGGKGRSGAAVLIDKTHPDYPPTWLTRHYGCLCVGWPGVKAGTLQPGKPVRCCYRVWVHRGQPDLPALKKAYEDYLARNAPGK